MPYIMDAVDTPLVTLAMPVRNGETYIEEALRSILAQSFQNFELVITDNASTDRSQEIIESYAARDKRIRYIRNEHDIGASRNFNKGFELARGRFLKWCAHDDFMSEDHLADLVALLESDDKAVLAFSRTMTVDSNGDLMPSFGDDMPPMVDDDAVDRLAKIIHKTGTCFPIFGLFKRDALQRSTLHRPYYGSDRALLCEMAVLGTVVCTEKTTFFNRHHGKRSIMIEDKAIRSLWQNGSAKKFAAAEHIHLLLHLIEISKRHFHGRDLRRARIAVAKLAFRREQLARYGLELLAFASPAVSRRAKSLMLRLSGASKKPTHSLS